MEVEARPQFTWIDLMKRSMVLDEIIQAVADYMPPDSGLSDKDCLSEIIGVIEKRLGQPFVGFE